MLKKSYLKNVVVFAGAFISIIMISIYLIYHYTPRPERSFLVAIGNALEKGSSAVFINDVVDFDWDTVCYLGPYTKQKHTSPHQFSLLIGFDFSNEFHQIPNLTDFSVYDNVFIFVKNNKLEKIYKFKGHTINVRGQSIPYKFKAKRKISDFCLKKNAAHFTLSVSQTNRPVIFLDDNINLNTGDMQ